MRIMVSLLRLSRSLGDTADPEAMIAVWECNKQERGIFLGLVLRRGTETERLKILVPVSPRPDRYAAISATSSPRWIRRNGRING